MYAADGIGLAAPQVGDTRRIIVVDVRRDVLGDEAGDSNLAPICMANPELIWISEDGELHEEGCLSLPQHFSEVHRPTAIRVLYLDKNNELQKIEAGGILATCVQHEVDHLNGVLFVDHVSSLKRNMILRKLQKSKKQAEAKIG